MDRRQFLSSAMLLGPSRGPRNVLLLLGDGASGLNGGVRFPNAFATTFSPGANLSVIHSGLHNHANGHYGQSREFHHFGYLPHVKPISRLLKDAGYRTGLIGGLPVHPAERFGWDLASADARDASGFVGRGRWFLQAGQDTGRMLEIVRQTGQFESTLVIATSSVGDARLRVPLLVRSPGHERLDVDGLASLTDLVPTILDWTRVKGPGYSLHGRSLLQGMRRDAVFFSHTFEDISIYQPLRGIRTRAHRYVLSLFPRGEKLYDLSQDPLETRSVSASAAYRGVLEELRCDVREFRLRTQDPWLGTE